MELLFTFIITLPLCCQQSLRTFLRDMWIKTFNYFYILCLICYHFILWKTLPPSKLLIDLRKLQKLVRFPTPTQPKSDIHFQFWTVIVDVYFECICPNLEIHMFVYTHLAGNCAGPNSEISSKLHDSAFSHPWNRLLCLHWALTNWNIHVDFQVKIQRQ